ncbi:MAG: choice-of-anchor Q domain-containing protein [Phycisphaerales bacterium]
MRRNFLLAIIILCCVFSYCNAAVRNVPAEYATIQSAINASVSGDRVIVQPGRYYENIKFNGKNINLTSIDPNNSAIVETTIIDGNRPSNINSASTVTFANSETKNAVIQGFTITGGTGTLDTSLGQTLYLGGGIFCKNSSPTIKLNIVANNICPYDGQTRYGGGIATLYSNAVINNNIIRDNDSLVAGGLITIYNKPLIYDNLIYDNSAIIGGGVILLGGGALVNNTIVRNEADSVGNLYFISGSTSYDMAVNNIICFAGQGGGVYCENPGDLNLFKYNCVWGNVDGDYCEVPDQTGINYNISQDPMLVNLDTDDFHLKPYSPCINAGTNSYFIPDEKDIDGQTRVLSSYIDIGTDEFSGYMIHYVNSGQSIQAKINDANSGDIIIVAPGRYYENLNFIGKDIILTSQNPLDWTTVEGTIIDGSMAANPDAASVVTFANGETQKAVIKGFTITGGSGTKTSSVNTSGGGIYCYLTTPVISQNIIKGNTASNDGGGIWVRQASPKIIGNKFIANSANRGGGIYGFGGVMEIRNNIFKRNSASSCGGIYARCESQIVSNLFYDNLATFDEAGAVSLRGANNSVFYCNTLAENSSVQTGANLAVQFCDNVYIANNIITDSLNMPGVYFYQNTNITFKYNDAWNNQGGNYEGILDPTGTNGNISLDPVYAENSDYLQLQVTSPCINAGDPDYHGEDGAKDVLGNQRIAAGRVDIGAFEYQGNIIPIADAGIDQTFDDLPVVVNLDGSASYDPLGDALYYTWRQIRGPKIELDHNDISQPTFVPKQKGLYVFSLIVDDGVIASKEDEVGIIIGCDRAPVADAGTARYALTSPVLLDGRSSYDRDGYGELTYQWRQISGPTVQITGADTAEPLISGFIPKTTRQYCKFELVVSDGLKESQADDVNVIIVPNYTTQQLVISNPPFDPEKPTILAFGGGNCTTGGSLSFGGTWSQKVNWITVSSYGTPYTKYGDMLLVLLSEIAPDYKEAIQTTGHSTGNKPAMEVAWYLNMYYKDSRYVVNRVSLLDAVCNNLSSRVSQYYSNRVAGEQCWVDNYVSNDTSYSIAAIINNTLNITCQPKRSHSYPVSRYMSSSFNYQNNGLDAFGYLSVVGEGKNFQLNTQANKYYFKIDGNEDIVFYNQSTCPGKILAPVQLTGTPDGSEIDEEDAVLGCLPCENAVKYELIMGPDKYNMIYKICESGQPIEKYMAAFPYRNTYWTVKCYDQFGSSIYADPILIKSDNIAKPVANRAGQEYLSCAGYELIWQKRISRTEFEYCLKMKLKNMTGYNVSNITVQLSCGYEEVKMMDDKIFFKTAPAGQEVVSDDSFIVRINRLYDIDANDFDLKISSQREADFLVNGKIDINDLRVLGQNWLLTGPNMPQDLYKDEIINFRDFGIFAEHWFKN